MSDPQLAGVAVAAWCTAAVIVAALVCFVICRIKGKGAQK